MVSRGGNPKIVSRISPESDRYRSRASHLGACRSGSSRLVGCAVEEYGGDQGCGFLEAAFVAGGHPGCGFELAAEGGEQYLGGEVAAEGAVVDAALQQGVQRVSTDSAEPPTAPRRAGCRSRQGCYRTDSATHTRLSWEAGIPPKLMDERMGHEDGSVQSRYGPITAGMRQALMAALTEIWEEALAARRAMSHGSPVARPRRPAEVPRIGDAPGGSIRLWPSGFSASANPCGRARRARESKFD
jgi:hypothetical protein